MSGLRAFDGFLFTPLVHWIIDGAAVSGGCFPSAHVSGAVGLTIGLAPAHRRLARWFGLVTVGLSVSCVYTRYHHAVDIFAGLLIGLAGGLFGYLLTHGQRLAPVAPAIVGSGENAITKSQGAKVRRVPVPCVCPLGQRPTGPILPDGWRSQQSATTGV